MGLWSGFRQATTEFCNKEDSDNKQGRDERRRSKHHQQAAYQKHGIVENKDRNTNLHKGEETHGVLKAQRRGNGSTGAAARPSGTDRPTVHKSINTKPNTSGDMDNKTSAESYVNSNAGFIERNTDAVEEHIPTDTEEKNLKRIQEIHQNSMEFEKKIETFLDVSKSDKFFSIDERLQRNIEKLDRIETGDSKLLSTEMKKVIKYIYLMIEKLEAKAKENEAIKLKEEETEILKMIKKVMKKCGHYDEEINSVLVVEKCEELYYDLEGDIKKLKSINTKHWENLGAKLQHCHDSVQYIMQRLINKAKKIDQQEKRKAATQTSEQRTDNAQIAAGDIQVAEEVTEIIKTYPDIKTSHEVMVLNKIHDIATQYNELSNRIESFSDLPGSEMYNYIGRSLEGFIKELSSLDTRDRELLKTVVIMNINSAIERLKRKAKENEKIKLDKYTAIAKRINDGDGIGNKTTFMRNVEENQSVRSNISKIAQDTYEEDILKQVSEILEKSEELSQKINSFSDIPNSQPFCSIQENLHRNIQKLDGIDRRNSAKLLEKIKAVVTYIYDMIEKLEAKAKNNERINKLREEEMQILKLVNEIVDETKQYNKVVDSVYDTVRYQSIYVDLKHKKEILNTIHTRNRENLVKEIKHCCDRIHSVMQKIKILHQIVDKLKQANKISNYIDSILSTPGNEEYNSIGRNLQKLVDELNAIDTGDNESLIYERKNVIKYINRLNEKLKSMRSSVHTKVQPINTTERNKGINDEAVASQVYSQSDKIGNETRVTNNLEEKNTAEKEEFKGVQSNNIKYAQEVLRTEQDIYEYEILKQVSNILEESKEIDLEINSFSDIVGSQQFKFICEKLHENIQRLDRIDGRNSAKLLENVRDASNYIYIVKGKLEAKAKDNEQIKLQEEMQTLKLVNEFADETRQYDNELDSVYDTARYESIYSDLKQKKQILNTIYETSGDNLVKEVKHCCDCIHSVMRKINILHQIVYILEQANDTKKNIESILDSPDHEEYYSIGKNLQKLIDDLNAIDTGDNGSLRYKRNYVKKYINHLNEELRSMHNSVYTEEQHVRTTERNKEITEHFVANQVYSQSNKTGNETTVTENVEETDSMEEELSKDSQSNTIKYAQGVDKIEKDVHEEELLKQVYDIMEESKEVDQMINSFTDVVSSQQFKFTCEKLRKNIQKLDRIDKRNSAKLLENINGVISYIYIVIEKLEAKAKDNKQAKLNEETQNLKLVNKIVDETKQYDKELDSVHDIARYQSIYLDLERKKEILNNIHKRNKGSLVKEIRLCYEHIHIVMQKIEILHKVYNITVQSKIINEKVESFWDIPNSEEYYSIGRNLQKLIDELNGIDTGESESLRDGRNNVIKYIYSVIDKLRAKAEENEKMKLYQQNERIMGENVSTDQVVTESAGAIKKTIKCVHTVINVETKDTDYETMKLKEHYTTEKLLENTNSKKGVENEQIWNSDIEYAREQDTASKDYIVQVLNTVEEIKNDAKHIEGRTDNVLGYGEMEQLYETLKRYTQELATIDAKGSELLMQKLDHEYDYVISVQQKLIAKAKAKESSGLAATIVTGKANIGESIKYVTDEQRAEDNIVSGQETPFPRSEQILQNIYKIKDDCKDLHEKVKSFLDIAGSEEYNYIAENLRRNLESLKQIDARDSILIKGHIRLGINHIHSVMKDLGQKAEENECIKLRKDSAIQKKVSDEKNRPGSGNKYEKTIRQLKDKYIPVNATGEYKVTKHEQSVNNNIKSTAVSEQIIQAPVSEDFEVNLRKIHNIMRNTNEFNAQISSFLDTVDSNEFISIDSDLQTNIKMLNDIDYAPLSAKIKEYVSYIDDVKYRLRLKAKENERIILRKQSSVGHSSGSNTSKENRNEQRTSGIKHGDDSVEDIRRGVNDIALDTMKLDFEPSFNLIKESLNKCEQINKNIDSFYDIPRSHKYYCISAHIQRNIDVLDSVYTGDSSFLKQEKEYAIRHTYRLKDKLEQTARVNQQMKLFRPTSL